MSSEHTNRQTHHDLGVDIHGEKSSHRVSIDERRRLVAESLRIGNPGNNARNLPQAADPQCDCPITLHVDQIHEYEYNPRRVGNAKFEEIKASIRSVGLRNPLTVTRRPGEAHFIVEAGGNTRLIAIQQLWAETQDSHFETLTVTFRPWRSESHVLTAHLIENEQRGELTYWDKASGVMRLRTELEKEQNRALSLSQLEEELRGRGYTLSKAALGFYAFAAERLRHLGHALPSLTSDVVKRLQQGFNRLRRYAESCHAVTEADLYSEVIDPVLVETGNRFAALGAIDPDAIWEQCASALAQYLCRPRVEVLSALGVPAISGNAFNDPSVATCAFDAGSTLTASSRTPQDPLAKLVRQLAALTGIEPLIEWVSETPCRFRLHTLSQGPDRQGTDNEKVERSRRAWQLLHCLASGSIAPADTDLPRERLTEATLMTWLLDTDDRSAGVFLDLVGAVRRTHRDNAFSPIPKGLPTAQETC